jgi:UDP-glucuronate 4-epimerase
MIADPVSKREPQTEQVSVVRADATSTILPRALLTACCLYQLPTISLRIFTVFGPRQRPDLAIRKFAQLIQAGGELPLFGDGSMSRDYTYVSDAVAAIDQALACSFSFEIFNLVNSRPIRLDYMIDTLERAMGKTTVRNHLPTGAEEMPITFASLDKSRSMLGSSPRVSFEEGIRVFVEWFKSC